MRARSTSSLSPSVCLAFFGFVLVGITGGANGILLPSMGAFYHIGDAILGLLFLVSSLGYFLSALSSGLLTERLGLRWLLGLGSATLLLGLLGFGLRLPFFLLVYVGVEVNIGNWSYSFLLEARHQGTVLAGWIVSGYWLGLTLGRFTLQALAERLGLSTRALMYACLTGIVIALVLVWLLPFGATAALGFFFIGFSLAPIYPLTVAIIPKLVLARLGPSPIGLLGSVRIIG